MRELSTASEPVRTSSIKDFCANAIDSGLMRAQRLDRDGFAIDPPAVSVAFARAIGCPVNDHVVINGDTHSYWTPGYGLAYKVGTYWEKRVSTLSWVDGYTNEVAFFLYEHALLHDVGHWLFAGKPQDGHMDWGLGFIAMPGQVPHDMAVTQNEADVQEALSQIFSITLGPELGMSPRIETGEWEGNDSWALYEEVKRSQWAKSPANAQKRTGFNWDVEIAEWREFLLGEYAEIARKVREEHGQ